MNKAEEFYIKRFGEPKDRHEKKFQIYDFYDMIDFAEQYAQREYGRGFKDGTQMAEEIINSNQEENNVKP